MWKVYRDGAFTGILESNYPYALAYWRERAKITGYNFKLIWMDI